MGKRILIVEDEEIILADVEGIVRRHNYEVAAAVSSGPAAIEAAAATSPDLVLMDVRLRGPMDGLTAAHNIRGHSDVPILFVTAYTGTVAFNAADLPGRHACIRKPFSPGELRTAIDSLLQT